MDSYSRLNTTASQNACFYLVWAYPKPSRCTWNRDSPKGRGTWRHPWYQIYSENNTTTDQSPGYHHTFFWFLFNFDSIGEPTPMGQIFMNLGGNRLFGVNLFIFRLYHRLRIYYHRLCIYYTIFMKFGDNSKLYNMYQIFRVAPCICVIRFTALVLQMTHLSFHIHTNWFRVGYNPHIYEPSDLPF